MSAADLWKPTDSNFIQNPYKVYRKIFEKEKVFKAHTGDYVVLGYHHCKQILKEHSFETGLRLKWIDKMAKESASRGHSLDHVKEAVSGMLVQLNPPDQQRIRTDFAKAWPTIDELKKISKEIILRALDELPQRFDAISLLSRKIPLQIINRLLGLDWNETQRYTTDGLNLVQVLGPYLSYRDVRSIDESTRRLQAFLKQSFSSDDYTPTKLTTPIIQTYTEDEMVNLLQFIFIAGYETTSSLLTLCLYHLIKNKEYSDSIKKLGIKPFIDEILRLHSPVQITGRTNSKSVELNGQQIPKNSALTLCIGAANVDPNQFDHAQEFMWNRPKREHLSFGYGMHFCLGNQLAEIEAEILIENILPILDKFEIVNEPVLRNILTIKSYESFDLIYN